MFDCEDDILAYHDDEITLPQPERTAMRDRRNANRDRVKEGLKNASNPRPIEFKGQGSYAMRTMTQHPENNYDIDDGVYFEMTDLVGPKGGDLSPLDARQMVRDAADDGCFKTRPEVRKNCVRVVYDAGYHIDIPVYRRVVTRDAFGQESVHYELASSEWKRSDARDVTKWFDTENNRQSGDTSNGRQLRRITREIKKFAKSRNSWRLLSGFGITKLVAECFRGNVNREDAALYDTMKAIRDRLNLDLVVKHPVTLNETITNGEKDPKAVNLKDRLSDAINWLAPLIEANCTREKAVKCWDNVFNTDFFSNRFEESTQAATAGSASVLSAGLLIESGQSEGARDAVQKQGGGRYA
ncbi:MAG: cyclic GMP-AMP synthase DncV-like nucleotidyltransferase [Gemmatimonadaceae bacterium]